MKLLDLLLAIRTERTRLLCESLSESNSSLSARYIYELACALEQVLSDLNDSNRDTDLKLYSIGRRWRRISAQLAYCTFYDSGSSLFPRLLSQAMVSAEEDISVFFDQHRFTPQQLGQHAKYPECFSRDLIDLTTYSEFIQMELEARRPEAAVVIGIRTTGSYLGPVWEAGLNVLGIPCYCFTVRPPRTEQLVLHPADKLAILTLLKCKNENGKVVAYIIDDIAFTGSSFVQVEDSMKAVGISVNEIVYTQCSELLPTSLGKEAQSRLLDRSVIVPKKSAPVRSRQARIQYFADLLSRIEGRPVRLMNVRHAAPTFMQRYFASRTIVPIDVVIEFDPRGPSHHFVLEVEPLSKSVYTPGPKKIFAKLFGQGLFAAMEIERLKLMNSVGYEVIGHHGGYLFYSWLDGELLGPGPHPELTSDHLKQIAAYSALSHQLNECSLKTPEVLCSEVRDSFEHVSNNYHLGNTESADWLIEDFLRNMHSYVPIYRMPRNQGYWHYILMPSGGIRRTHLDSGEWTLNIDLAEELASSVLELQLSPSQAQFLIQCYIQETGDRTVQRRLALGSLSYLSRVLDNYSFYDSIISRMPVEYLRIPTDTKDRQLLIRKEQTLTSLRNLLHDGLFESFGKDYSDE